MKLFICLFTSMLTFQGFSQTYKEWFDLGNKYFDEVAYAQSVDAFTKAVELRPDLPGTYVSRGIARMYLNDCKGVIADFDQAEKLNYPESIAIYSQRGICKKILNDLAGALADFDKAIALDPEDVYCRNERGVLRYDIGDIQGALIDFNKAIEIDPFYMKVIFNKGILIYNLNDAGKAKEALECFSRVIQIDSTISTAYLHRGLIMQRFLDQPGGALKEFNKAILLDSTLALAYYSRGSIKRNMKDYQGALKDYSKAIDLNPKDSEAYKERGVVYGLFLNNPQAALKDFDKTIEFNPSDAEGYHNRGVAKLSLRQEGCTDLKKALSLGHSESQGAITEYCH